MNKIKCLLIMMMIMMLTACGSNHAEESDTVEKQGIEDSGSENNSAEEETEKVKIFGVFDSQTLEGEDVTEDIFSKADLTMVNIWGTFCSPCIAEMPDLGEISREYADRGFQIVGLLSDVEEPGDETALQIVNETKADYCHMVASEDLIINVLQYVSAVPTTIFVDKEGNMVGQVYSGSRDKESWELIINQCLVEVQ